MRIILVVLLLLFSTPALAQQPGQEMYGQDYMTCLNTARQRTAYVDVSMREQAMGEMLNMCMYQRGWQQFAPVDEAEERRERMMWMNNY